MLPHRYRQTRLPGSSAHARRRAPMWPHGLTDALYCRMRLSTYTLLACALGCNPEIGAGSGDPQNLMIVIGHRGASGYAPEHTFASWDRALELGADYLEQDLQMTRDGVLVVVHDDTMERTTAGACRARVIDMTLADVQQCEVGTWFNRLRPEHARAEYAAERVRTLDEVFARYAERASF